MKGSAPLVKRTRDRSEKLRPIAARVARMLEARFGCPAPFVLEATLAWLPSLPDRQVHRYHWTDLARVYRLLVDGRWTFDERLQEFAGRLRSGRQRVDIWFESPYRFVLEFDEWQHFNRFRLLTLEHFPGYRHFPFDYHRYINLCRQGPDGPGTTSFEKLKSFDPLFPPLLEGAAQDNRMRQRAFRDFLKDLTPTGLPDINPTLRLSYLVTNGKSGFFDEADLTCVEAHIADCGFLDRIKPVFSPARAE